jgi:hypothetical protein
MLTLRTFAQIVDDAHSFQMDANPGVVASSTPLRLWMQFAGLYEE